MKRYTALAIAIFGLTGVANAEGELQLYNWGNYTSPELITKFEAETGIKVTITDYDSNDTALAKIETGSHGYDLVVPSANYVPIYRERGLAAKLDLARLPNHKNIAPEWSNPAWDEGRNWSVPWQWGTLGVAVDTALYSGNINTSAIFLDVPDALKGKINVLPEMMDVITLATLYYGGEMCSEDLKVMKKVRDGLVAAKPDWLSMDYGAVEKLSNGDWAASTSWNGDTMRARLNRPTLKYGYPQEGFLLWMDNVMLLSEAKNVDEAYMFLNFIMQPENAALLSKFARYGNGIAGSEAFMPDDMLTAPEIAIPEDLKAAGKFLPICSDKAREYATAVWVELMK